MQENGRYPGEEFRPDLILMDIRLSATGKEGAVICERIKSRKATADIPIILLSAERDIRHVCEQCGANGYVSKPFDVGHLTGKVRQMIDDN